VLREAAIGRPPPRRHRGPAGCRSWHALIRAMSLAVVGRATRPTPKLRSASSDDRRLRSSRTTGLPPLLRLFARSLRTRLADRSGATRTSSAGQPQSGAITRTPPRSRRRLDDGTFRTGGRPRRALPRVRRGATWTSRTSQQPRPQWSPTARSGPVSPFCTPHAHASARPCKTASRQRRPATAGLAPAGEAVRRRRPDERRCGFCTRSSACGPPPSLRPTRLAGSAPFDSLAFIRCPTGEPRPRHTLPPRRGDPPTCRDHAAARGGGLQQAGSDPLQSPPRDSPTTGERRRAVPRPPQKQPVRRARPRAPWRRRRRTTSPALPHRSDRPPGTAAAARPPCCVVTGRQVRPCRLPAPSARLPSFPTACFCPAAMPRPSRPGPRPSGSCLGRPCPVLERCGQPSRGTGERREVRGGSRGWRALKSCAVPRAHRRLRALRRGAGCGCCTGADHSAD